MRNTRLLTHCVPSYTSSPYREGRCNTCSYRIPRRVSFGTFFQWRFAACSGIVIVIGLLQRGSGWIADLARQMMRRSFQATPLNLIKTTVFRLPIGKTRDLFWLLQERRLLWGRVRILRHSYGTPRRKILSIPSVELHVQSQFLGYLDTRRLVHLDGTAAKRLRHHATESTHSRTVRWGAPLWDRLETHWWGSPLEPWMQRTTLATVQFWPQDAASLMVKLVIWCFAVTHSWSCDVSVIAHGPKHPCIVDIYDSIAAQGKGA